MTVTEVEPRECSDCGFRGGHASNCDTNNANDPEPEGPRVFHVPATNFETLSERFAKLQKKAVKLGVPAPTFEIVDIETQYEFVFDGSVQDHYWSHERTTASQAHPTGRTRKVYNIVVSGEAPKFAGWSLLGVVERDPQFPDLDNIVNVVSGEADPAWRKLGDCCDHCAAAGHTKGRGRKQLVVVEHENGERKVVGKTCLRDFLGGSSPERIASWCEWLGSFYDECEDSESEEYRGAREEQRVEAAAYLGFVAKIIHEIGWTPRSHAGGDLQATADIAIAQLTWRPRGRDNEPPTQPTPENYDEARQAIEWGQSIDADNDYLRNLKIVCSKDVWRYKELGIGASVISAYRRAQEQEIKRTLRAKVEVDSEYVGEIGQRIEITGTVTFTIDREGQWGPQTLVKIVTDDGNLITWWASGRAPEQGQRVTGKATIKKHAIYSTEKVGDVKQTTVQRFSWTEVKETA